MDQTSRGEELDRQGRRAGRGGGMGQEVPPLGDNLREREGPQAVAGVGGDGVTWASHTDGECAALRNRLSPDSSI